MTHTLTAAAHEQVKELTVIATHYKQMLEVLEKSITKVVSDDAGVDLAGETQWKLDLATGELSDGQ